ncbi:MAG: winged helix-turn-helix transcriptional regulator [Candidatus Pristimantibacillus lignocellulolyticus]|uniref:Winged helix-turn-helix transcriptional regulator n=1 Tax=Candidatus Pristimantibacillus lignocellulolyticus TaxID=2994561 RepID=A0A9J6ZL79_9BACL|nr:MAG: winged helix-turn-helix transcriptional regulator [Candidatus Pristimantibacillus lignocellulolyticus]
MEEDRIVIREVFAEVPLTVEYQLCEFGDSLRPISCLLDTNEAAYLLTTDSKLPRFVLVSF